MSGRRGSGALDLRPPGASEAAMIFPFDFRKPLFGALMAFLSVAAAAQTLTPAPEVSSGRTAKTTSEAAKYMVAAADSLAAEAGREILRAGGSAVDAAIAVQLVLNLVEPQSSGIGGGAFMVHWNAGARELATIDGRETAPAAAKPQRFIGPVVGGRSVGVPGTLRLLEAAHRKWGKLPWQRMFEPAIRLAEEGFTISPRLNRRLGKKTALQQDPRAKAYFY